MNCLNSKQKAVKLFMNTFYGEAGNHYFQSFSVHWPEEPLPLVNTISNLLQNMWKRKALESKYGDTDSLYLTCPDKYFEKCDEAFSRKELSKEAYWTEMDKKWDLLSKDGLRRGIISRLLYWQKEVLGVGHEDVVNFKPKNLFMKGIETVKQGKSQLLKFIGEKIMREAMDIIITRSIHDIVEDTLREAGTRNGISMILS
ncbi:unnamed protein product [Rhizophagus irregularis]|nr:unnamed protein product [Rhizophagus irregularis]